MRIRAAGPDDVATVARLNAEVQALHLAAMPGLYRATVAAEVQDWFRCALGDGVAIFLAEDGPHKAAIGYVVVRRIDVDGTPFTPPRRIAMVDQIAVAAGARRRGAGRALMAAAGDLARGWGAAAVVLDVMGFNEEALLFYRALGFETMLNRLTLRV